MPQIVIEAEMSDMSEVMLYLGHMGELNKLIIYLKKLYP